ncbi:hypothetical protein K7432_001072 [Basidiobolus ranarum]|uniref:tRNA N(3)-methylcytidine methyltransferase n=1 Tax=Basidiobolus ranarum TaxID=34480 RepID=A0ABR2X3J4_9FUNG
MNAEKEAQAKEILAKDDSLVPEFWANKYTKEAAKNWDLFYKRNTTNFFKDRHWIDREFEELRYDPDQAPEKKVCLEVGCGVGNFIYPVLNSNPNLFMHACDFSQRAVDFVKNNPQYAEGRCNAFVCDLTKDKLQDNITPCTVDFISAIFVLSAIPPEKMSFAVQNLYEVLNTNGQVLFRDYGLYDQAQLRFKPGSKLKDNFYVRQDGTMAYYFSKEYLIELFTKEGFELVNVEYIAKETVNRKRDVVLDRVFIQARFRKV